jgi:lycopene beta-cyclase
MMSFGPLVYLLFLVAATDGFQGVPVRTATSKGIVGTASHHVVPLSKAFSGAVSLSVRSSGRKSTTTATRASSYCDDILKKPFDYNCDILVLGSGPAARSIASLLGANNLHVILADQKEERDWAPNYGVWEDEWEAIVKKYKGMGITLEGGNVGQCVDRAWPVTDCYFGGSFDIPTEQRMRLDRPYYRVDRFALRKSLMTGNYYETIRANHISKAVSVNMYEPAGSLVHDSEGSTTILEKAGGEQVTVRSKLIVDCTGHETKLVLRETRDSSPSPGFQIAYGMLVDVDDASFRNDKTEIGPYNVEAMTLFDYRTDHFDDAESEIRKKVEKAPTFMYGMFSHPQTHFHSEVVQQFLTFYVSYSYALERQFHIF